MRKNYTSFQEIDQRLKILKLQCEIDQENLKLNVQNAKVDMVPQLFRTGLGINFTQSNTLKSVFVTFIANKVLGFIRSKRQSKSEDSQ